jgi:hypothetical protein
MAALKYMFRDRSGNWLYKRQFKDKGWYNRSFRTTSETKAIALWPKANAEFERLNQQRIVQLQYKFSKDKRRGKIWASMARFLLDQRKANGGRLSRPDHIYEPVETRVSSHPFSFVRSAFLSWCRDNDPDAEAVFRMGDMIEEPLFRTGIVAAWFIVSEMERMDDKAFPEK